jgi:hypothetical protein
MAKANPIMIYKSVQTGPKTQEGGLKKGLTKVGNQVFTEDCVAKPDKNPTKTHTKTDIIPFKSLIFAKIQIFNEYQK